MKKFPSWSFLPVLLLVLVQEGSAGRDHMLRLHHDTMDGGHHVHPSAAAIDPQAMVFFTMNDLKMGTRLPLYFPNKPLASKFLPREEADSIPFSLNSLPEILQRFSFSPDSPQAAAVEDALRSCERSPIHGETKTCATSMESLLDFTRGVFGLEEEDVDDHLNILTTKYYYQTGSAVKKKKKAGLQNYTVAGEAREVVVEAGNSKMVACHKLPYPYAVFYCHGMVGETRVFMVALVGEDGDMQVDAVAVCHMDTSQWSRKHASFQVLGIQPGSSHVCHVLPPDNMVLVPAAATPAAII